MGNQHLKSHQYFLYRYGWRRESPSDPLFDAFLNAHGLLRPALLDDGRRPLERRHGGIFRDEICRLLRASISERLLNRGGGY